MSGGVTKPPAPNDESTSPALHSRRGSRISHRAYPMSFTVPVLRESSRSTDQRFTGVAGIERVVDAGVGSRPAGEPIGAAAAEEAVVSAGAAEVVVADFAEQGVVARAAEEVIVRGAAEKPVVAVAAQELILSVA